jgi:pimeloyl-ACP methyl ester carboxylesterase
MQKLEGDLPVQATVARQIHRPHRAATEDGQNFVGSDSSAWTEGHFSGSYRRGSWHVHRLPTRSRGRQVHKRGDEQIRELQQQFHNFKDSYDDMNFTRPYLSIITARTLIVHGDRDPFFPVEIPIEMYRGIPNAELWIIPHGGHVPMFGPGVQFWPTAQAFLEGSGR